MSLDVPLFVLVISLTLRVPCKLKLLVNACFSGEKYIQAVKCLNVHRLQMFCHLVDAAVVAEQEMLVNLVLRIRWEVILRCLNNVADQVSLLLVRGQQRDSH